ncbi:INO80 complex subunit E isoform X2 [Lepisosteus oculatus]|uniref:INO80 complex subunit E isoform X2 n=1 Tax=Lepisosteus oculatus TaxID=7918 RepID=UPI0035F50E14
MKSKLGNSAIRSNKLHELQKQLEEPTLKFTLPRTGKMNGQPEIETDYKKKYKNLKRKLKFLVYEQECFQEELRRAQRKLLKVCRDKSFLLDRLLQYEHVDDDSSDSDATVSSDNSDGEGRKMTESTGAKKRRSSPHLPNVPSPSSSLALLSKGFTNLTSGPGPYLSTVAGPAPAPSSGPAFPVAAPPMPPRPFSWVPRQMLSGDAPEDGSNGESEREEERGEGEEAELVIDIPNE